MTISSAQRAISDDDGVCVCDGDDDVADGAAATAPDVGDRESFCNCLSVVVVIVVVDDGNSRIRANAERRATLLPASLTFSVPRCCASDVSLAGRPSIREHDRRRRDEGESEE